MILKTTRFNSFVDDASKNPVAHILEIALDRFNIVHTQETYITKSKDGRDMVEVDLPPDKAHLAYSSYHMIVITDKDTPDFEEFLARYHASLLKSMDQPWTPLAGMEKGLIA